MAIRPRVTTRRLATLRSRGLSRGQPPSTGEDGYMAKLVKYIPAEVVAAYLFVAGAIEQATGPQSAPWLPLLFWGWFGLVLVLTYPWTLRTAREPGVHPAHAQAIIAVVVFAIWAYVHGGPFRLMAGLRQPLIGTVLLGTSSLASPLLGDWLDQVLAGRSPSQPVIS